MPLNSILDSAITRRLARYLEMSDASSGFSDVVVKDGHITVHHAVAKLEPANELLAEKGVPEEEEEEEEEGEAALNEVEQLRGRVVALEAELARARAAAPWWARCAKCVA